MQKSLTANMAPGRLMALRPGVRRLVAPNAGPLTGPGTNSYLLGQRQVAVIDPGPVHAGHAELLLRAADGRIRWLIATHTHPDHSPGVKGLARLTGAEVLGMPPPADIIQDQTFSPTRVLQHDDVLETDEFTLRVIHTPGHASNHLCFFHQQEKLLFTGDHIINGSTVVINPPDGDMGVYLRSLDLLHGYEMEQIAPGHGDLLDQPHGAVDRLIEHRLAREAKVSHCLERQAGPVSLDELVVSVYDDVPAGIHGLAKRSLKAHLLKLQTEGRVRRQGPLWATLH